ncbi:MAG: hypothetical protein ACI4AH_00785 [Muribaculaceae bacterium]
MKRVLFIIAAFAVIVGLSACKNQKIAKLRDSVEKTNRECPIDMGMFGEVTSISYDEDLQEVEFTYRVNEQMVSIESVRSNEHISKQQIKLALSQDKSKELLQLMVDAGTSLNIVYNGATTGDEFSMTISVDDLKEMCNSKMSQSEKYKAILECQIAIENSRCPMDIDELTIFTKVYDDGDNIIYLYDIDDTKCNFADLKENAKEIRSNIEGSFSDPTLKKILGMIAALRKGVIFRYVGRAYGDSFDVMFKSAELPVLAPPYNAQ